MTNVINTVFYFSEGNLINFDQATDDHNNDESLYKKTCVH